MWLDPTDVPCGPLKAKRAARGANSRFGYEQPERKFRRRPHLDLDMFLPNNCHAVPNPRILALTSLSKDAPTPSTAAAVHEERPQAFAGPESFFSAP